LGSCGRFSGEFCRHVLLGSDTQIYRVISPSDTPTLGLAERVLVR
jgi:hypothetical protein